MLALQKNQNNCLTNLGNITIFFFWFNLTSDISSSIQQISTVTQEPSVIPQNALPDSGASALVLASSSAPITDEVPRIQVRYFIFRNSERKHLINIPSSLTRHKTVQTTVCSLFNSGPSMQKMRLYHQQNRLHCLKKPRPNSMKSCSCWTKTLAHWFKMLIRFALSWSLWRAFSLNLLKKHCIPLLTSKVTRSLFLKPRSVSLIGFTKSKRSNKEMIWRILWKQPAGRLPLWLNPRQIWVSLKETWKSNGKSSSKNWNK